MADETPTATDKTGFVTVELAEPIRRGTTEIATITLRKPRSGELRGLSMQDLLTSDVTAILKLIPRISSPPLIQDEADALDPEDLAEVAGAIRGFFMTKAERVAIDRLIAEHQPTT